MAASDIDPKIPPWERTPASAIEHLCNAMHLDGKDATRDAIWEEFSALIEHARQCELTSQRYEMTLRKILELNWIGAAKDFARISLDLNLPLNIKLSDPK